MKFYVGAFETTATLDLLASVYTEQTDPITADATATINVTKEELYQIFKFQTDAADITDANNPDTSTTFEDVDIKFYTYYDGFTAVASELNPANALVTDNAIVTTDATTGGDAYPDDKMMVAHDFIRHLADDMFTTPYAVDLFDNEVNLLKNIRTVCGQGTSAGGQKYVLENIADKIKSVSTIVGDISGIETDVNSLKYMPNINVENSGVKMNLGRILFSQMMSDATRITSWLDPSNAVLPLATFPRDQPLPLPFVDGDEIIFKVILKAAPTQHELVRSSTPVADRSYKIIWKVSPNLNVVPSLSEA
jgi:hypothetical protein